MKRTEGEGSLVKVTSFLIGGTHSNSGKTTISLGIMAALMDRGLKVQPYKCGPDFIDPTLHEMVTGRVSRNLDLRMCGPSWCKKLFTRTVINSDVGIIEGVMGLFDGGTASTAALAVTLSIPVILIIDVRSAAESVAAVLKGFESLDPEVNIAGVIFNNVGSKRHEQLIRDSVLQHCNSAILGFVPRESDFRIPDRHLGLHMGSETPLRGKRLKNLGETIEACIDLDLMLTFTTRITSSKSRIPCKSKSKKRMLRLGIARDKAFCFYYQDNFDIFKKHGFELIFFSPLTDTSIPANLDMLYFGGGYPELHSKDLSANISMIDDVKTFADRGGLIYCECGGFMYLGREILDQQKGYNMVGIFPMSVQMNTKLRRLGYREVTLLVDGPFGKKGEHLYGHEFHYSEIVSINPDVEKMYRLQDGRFEGYRVGNTIGGYLHLHFGRSQNNIQQLSHYIRNI